MRRARAHCSARRILGTGTKNEYENEFEAEALCITMHNAGESGGLLAAGGID